MAVRITPAGATVSHYNGNTKKWSYTNGISIGVLSRDVHFQPGVTIGNIMSIIEEALDVKSFFESYSYIDFKAMRDAPPKGDGSPMVPAGIEPDPASTGPLQSYKVTGYEQSNFIALERSASHYEEDGEKCVIESFRMMYRSDMCDGGISLGKAVFADVKDTELRLRSNFVIYDDEADKTLMDARCGASLLQVLEAVCSPFGHPPAYAGWTQRSVDETERMRDMFRQQRSEDSEYEESEEDGE